MCRCIAQIDSFFNPLVRCSTVWLQIVCQVGDTGHSFLKVLKKMYLKDTHMPEPKGCNCIENGDVRHEAPAHWGGGALTVSPPVPRKINNLTAFAQNCRADDQCLICLTK